MPVEQAAGSNRQNVSHLEAIGRLMAGLGPWIELSPDTSQGRLRAKYADPRAARFDRPSTASPDFLNFARVSTVGRRRVSGQGIPRATRAPRDGFDAERGST
jgi:hypothetical protein